MSWTFTTKHQKFRIVSTKRKQKLLSANFVTNMWRMYTYAISKEHPNSSAWSNDAWKAILLCSNEFFDSGLESIFILIWSIFKKKNHQGADIVVNRDFKIKKECSGLFWPIIIATKNFKVIQLYGMRFETTIFFNILMMCLFENSHAQNFFITLNTKGISVKIRNFIFIIIS